MSLSSNNADTYRLSAAACDTHKLIYPVAALSAAVKSTLRPYVDRARSGGTTGYARVETLRASLSEQVDGLGQAAFDEVLSGLQDVVMSAGEVANTLGGITSAFDRESRETVVASALSLKRAAAGLELSFDTFADFQDDNCVICTVGATEQQAPDRFLRLWSILSAPTPDGVDRTLRSILNSRYGTVPRTAGAEQGATSLGRTLTALATAVETLRQSTAPDLENIDKYRLVSEQTKIAHTLSGTDEYQDLGEASDEIVTRLFLEEVKRIVRSSGITSLRCSAHLA